MASLFIPKITIDAITDTLPIQDVIAPFIDKGLKREGPNYRGLCPFHNEKTASFSVSPAKKMFKGFGCGEGGNVLKFVMKYKSLTFPEAAKLIADAHGIAIPDVKADNIRRKEVVKKDEVLTLVDSGEPVKEFDYQELPMSKELLRGIISSKVWDAQDEAKIIATVQEYGLVALAEYVFTKPGDDEKESERGKMYQVKIKATPTQPVFMFCMEG